VIHAHNYINQNLLDHLGQQIPLLKPQAWRFVSNVKRDVMAVNRKDYVGLPTSGGRRTLSSRLFCSTTTLSAEQLQR
jgi:hypothetical protein